MSTPPERRSYFIGLAILIAIGLAIAIAFALRPDDASIDDEAVRRESADGTDDDGYFDDEPIRSSRGDGRRVDESVRGTRDGIVSPDPRVGFRDRLGERAEHWRTEVEIAALGPSSRALDPEQLVEPLEAGMEELTACIDRHGGHRAFRDATRPPDGATRVRRRSTFDIRADGTVDPASVAFEPAIPAPFIECFDHHIENARFPAPGGEGVRVDIPLRRPRREPPVVTGGGGEDGGVSRSRR